ncbi:unnamed protein product [Amoebophrya sp. A25]|nr:unnamed protein product [Amoebophrya sp. A25]|eukprot:GSA25T00025041001.1
MKPVGATANSLMKMRLEIEPHITPSPLPAPAEAAKNEGAEQGAEEEVAKPVKNKYVLHDGNPVKVAGFTETFSTNTYIQKLIGTNPSTAKHLKKAVEEAVAKEQQDQSGGEEDGETEKTNFVTWDQMSVQDKRLALWIQSVVSHSEREHHMALDRELLTGLVASYPSGEKQNGRDRGAEKKAEARLSQMVQSGRTNADLRGIGYHFKRLSQMIPEWRKRVVMTALRGATTEAGEAAP